MRRETISRPRWHPAPRPRLIETRRHLAIVMASVVVLAIVAWYAFTRPIPTNSCTRLDQPPGAFPTIDYRGGNLAGEWYVNGTLYGYAAAEDAPIYADARCAAGDGDL